MNVQRRRGIAIPLVLLFVFVVSVYFFSMAFTRTETRRQGLSNLNQRQAYYMAMGGVQQALLKSAFYTAKPTMPAVWHAASARSSIPMVTIWWPRTLPAPPKPSRPATFS